MLKSQIKGRTVPIEFGHSKLAPKMQYVRLGNSGLKHIFDNVKLALKRLQTDYIDVLQLHRFDYETPNFYNLLYREEEREMMPLLKYLGVGSTPWSPMAKGHLTRPLSEAYDTVRSTSDAFHDEALLGVEWEKTINQRVEELAKKRGFSMAQIALAWVLHKDIVAAPVVGISKIERFEETIAALEIELSDDEMKFLEEPYQP
ncbi:hypothetical protein G7Z17_g2007 [Cylindrodendrum hubeiense]|uniref:NADP-dependent oxidoreductase domain-containing protein n=1 Tax=Cylindrodendrum hubeiense TaxID=595255 RepID=A0A9P5HLS6_9HYPO|nr:hypothetical protein G7Z17_g2007 [Cylindrodendrum hubeiense]